MHGREFARSGARQGREIAGVLQQSRTQLRRRSPGDAGPEDDREQLAAGEGIRSVLEEPLTRSFAFDGRQHGCATFAIGKPHAAQQKITISSALLSGGPDSLSGWPDALSGWPDASTALMVATYRVDSVDGRHRRRHAPCSAHARWPTHRHRSATHAMVC